MISLSSTHTRLLREYLVATLNRDDEGQLEDPLPFPPDVVVVGNVSGPIAGDSFVRVTELGRVAIGEAEAVREDVDDVLLVRHRGLDEVTVTVFVEVRQPAREPSIETSANRYALRVKQWLFSGYADRMRWHGLAPLRSGAVLHVPRMPNGSQWVTRAAVEVTFSVSDIVTERPGHVETIEVSGTVGETPETDIVATREE